MMWMPFTWTTISILIRIRERIFRIMSGFAAYGRGFTRRADWRRDNVNVLIKEIHETVRECKPWVKFGVSPFGIYRNKKNDPNGSETNGLQNYDDLYADVLLWVNNGWVDYNIPQIYWEIGHPAADYDTLIRWWARHSAGSSAVHRSGCDTYGIESGFDESEPEPDSGKV